MICVISPAKKLDFEQTTATSTATQGHTTPEFLSQSRKLNRILKEYSELDLMELMKISQKIAALNVERNHAWKTPFKPGNARQALFAFRGDVYRGLDADTLKTADINFAQKHLRILSGLYGLLKPLDLMQAYRLEMGSRLSNPKGKTLYDFWGTQLTDKINQELAAQKSSVLVNLASNEYFKSIQPKLLQGELITPVFKEKKGKEFRIVAIHAKKARGLMCRFIVKNRIDQPAAIKDFDLADYRFNARQSNDKNWVFTR